MKMTMSIRQGKGSIRHNNRIIITDNVDKNRCKDNYYLKQEKLIDAYEKLFGEAIREYDAKQKRKDRKIGSAQNYIDKLKNSKNNEKLYYEDVVQVGNMQDFWLDKKCTQKNQEYWKEAEATLCEYFNSWNERNPNLYIFNAVLHMDEKSPHLHIDYIPIARDYKKGLNCRNSLDKALGQQGVDITGNSDKKHNRTIKWHNMERKALGGTMMKHNIEILEVGLKTEHQEINDYKKAARIAQSTLEFFEEHNDIKARPNKFNKDEVIVSKHELERLEEKKALVLSAETQIKMYFDKDNGTGKLLKENNALKSENDTLKETIKNKDAHIEKLTKSINNSNIENELAEAREELNKTKKSYNSLKEKFDDISSQLREASNTIIEKKNDILWLEKDLQDRDEELEQWRSGKITKKDYDQEQEYIQEMKQEHEYSRG